MGPTFLVSCFNHLILAQGGYNSYPTYFRIAWLERTHGQPQLLPCYQCKHPYNCVLGLCGLCHGFGDQQATWFSRAGRWIFADEMAQKSGERRKYDWDPLCHSCRLLVLVDPLDKSGTYCESNLLCWSNVIGIQWNIMLGTVSARMLCIVCFRIWRVLEFNMSHLHHMPGTHKPVWCSAGPFSSHAWVAWPVLFGLLCYFSVCHEAFWLLPPGFCLEEDVAFGSLVVVGFFYMFLSFLVFFLLLFSKGDMIEQDFVSNFLEWLVAHKVHISGLPQGFAHWSWHLGKPVLQPLLVGSFLGKAFLPVPQPYCFLDMFCNTPPFLVNDWALTWLKPR